MEFIGEFTIVDLEINWPWIFNKLFNEGTKHFLKSFEAYIGKCYDHILAICSHDNFSNIPANVILFLKVED